jgi:hypothetical protein
MDYTKKFESQDEYLHPDKRASFRYQLTDTDVFYKQKDETFEIFFTRTFNQLMIINRPINETRIHINFNDNTKNANWIAVDYINLSNE